MHKAWDTCGCRGGCVFGRGETGIWKTPCTSPQFCCDLETALKNSLLRNMWIIYYPSIFGSSRCRNCQTEHNPSQQLTAQNPEGHVRALPQAKGDFLYLFLQLVEENIQFFGGPGMVKGDSCGPASWEKAYKSMAASRLRSPGCTSIMWLPRKPDGGQMWCHSGVLPFPHLVAHLAPDWTSIDVFLC